MAYVHTRNNSLNGCWLIDIEFVIMAVYIYSNGYVGFNFSMTNDKSLV